MTTLQYIFVQALGFIGSFIAITALQSNSRRRVLTLQAVCCVLWIVHYACLGAYTGVVINVVSMGRAFVFNNNEKPWARHRFWLWLFAALFALSPALSWAGVQSLLPCAAMVLTTFGLWTHDMRKTRLLFLLNSPLMLAYDLWVGSWSTAAIEAAAFLSFAVAIWRFDLRKREK